MKYASINRVRDTQGELTEFFKLFRDLIPAEGMFVATEKVHGKNGQYHKFKDNSFQVGGRDGKSISFGKESLIQGMEYVDIINYIHEAFSHYFKDEEIIVYFELAGGTGKSQVQKEIDYAPYQFIYIFDILMVGPGDTKYFLSYNNLLKTLRHLFYKENEGLGFTNKKVLWDNNPTFGMFKNLITLPLKGIPSKLFSNALSEGRVLRGYDMDIVLPYVDPDSEDKTPFFYRMVFKLISPDFEEVKPQFVEKPKSNVVPLFAELEEKIIKDITAYCTEMRLSKVVGNLSEMTDKEINTINFRIYVNAYVKDCIKDYNTDKGIEDDTENSGNKLMVDTIKRELLKIVKTCQKKP